MAPELLTLVKSVLSNHASAAMPRAGGSRVTQSRELQIAPGCVSRTDGHSAGALLA